MTRSFWPDMSPTPLIGLAVNRLRSIAETKPRPTMSYSGSKSRKCLPSGPDNAALAWSRLSNRYGTSKKLNALIVEVSGAWAVTNISRVPLRADWIIFTSPPSCDCGKVLIVILPADFCLSSSPIFSAITW
ncbi:hypothetical protein D3C85_1496570 [compost metagenome]